MKCQEYLPIKEREREKWSLLLKFSHCQCLLELTILQFPKASELFCTHFNNNRISQCIHILDLVDWFVKKKQINRNRIAGFMHGCSFYSEKKKTEKFRMQPFECVYLKISRCPVTLPLCVHFQCANIFQTAVHSYLLCSNSLNSNTQRRCNTLFQLYTLEYVLNTLRRLLPCFCVAFAPTCTSSFTQRAADKNSTPRILHNGPQILILHPPKRAYIEILFTQTNHLQRSKSLFKNVRVQVLQTCL